MKENKFGSEIQNDHNVKCIMCDKYYYEDLGTKSDIEHLQLLYEKDDLKKEFPYKGCGNCQTDGYLMNLT